MLTTEINFSTGLSIKWIAKHFVNAKEDYMIGSSNVYNLEKMISITKYKLNTIKNRNSKQQEKSIKMFSILLNYLNTVAMLISISKEHSGK